MYILNHFLHTATHCNTLQHTATHCNTLQHVTTHSKIHISDLHFHVCINIRPPHWEKTYRHSATHCNTLQHTVKHCNTLQHTATHCNTLHHNASHCNTLQHTATHKDITEVCSWAGNALATERCALLLFRAHQMREDWCFLWCGERSTFLSTSEIMWERETLLQKTVMRTTQCLSALWKEQVDFEGSETRA